MGDGWEKAEEEPRIKARMARTDVSFLAPGLRGKLGGVVFVRADCGSVLRERVVGRDPRSPAQQAQRDRVRRVGRAWRDLDPGRVAAWRDYALGLGPGVQAHAVFSSLGVRALLAGAPAVPLDPPGAPFLGDSVRLEAAGGPGRVEVAGSAANGQGVVTELLLQRLESANRRTYLSRYRSARVLALPGPGTVELPARPGWWAVGARFLFAQTGQATAIAELGVVQAAPGSA